MGPGTRFKIWAKVAVEGVMVCEQSTSLAPAAKAVAMTIADDETLESDVFIEARFGIKFLL